MSDVSAAADAMPVRRALRRCTGAPGCPCVSHSSASPSRASTSPSRSWSATPAATNSGESVNASGSYNLSDSQANSESVVPDGVPEPEWSGLGIVRVQKCEHGRHADLKKCTAGKHFGRRYLGCPIQNESKMCQFVEWLDEPWPERVQQGFKEIWKELKMTRCCQASANEALIEAPKIKKVATEANSNLKAKVHKTRRVAHQVCSDYHRRAAVAVIDKSKLMYLIYCLLGVIAFLVGTIFMWVK